MLDFRKAFFPTKEESEAQRKLLDYLFNEKVNYLLSQGLSEYEIEVMIEMERKESLEIHRYQYWVSRYSLLESGIIAVDDIRNDIKKYLGGIDNG